MAAVYHYRAEHSSSPSPSSFSFSSFSSSLYFTLTTLVWPHCTTQSIHVFCFLNAVCLSVSTFAVLLISLLRDLERVAVIWQIQNVNEVCAWPPPPTSALHCPLLVRLLCYLFVSACHEQCQSLCVSFYFILLYSTLWNASSLSYLQSGTATEKKLLPTEEEVWKHSSFLCSNRLTAFLSFFLQDLLAREAEEDVPVMLARQDHWWVIYELLLAVLCLPSARQYFLLAILLVLLPIAACRCVCVCLCLSTFSVSVCLLVSTCLPPPPPRGFACHFLSLTEYLFHLTIIFLYSLFFSLSLFFQQGPPGKPGFPVSRLFFSLRSVFFSLSISFNLPMRIAAVRAAILTYRY